MITMLRRHGMTWHDMMTTRYTMYSISLWYLKKKIKIVSDELIDTHTHTSTNQRCKKSFDAVRVTQHAHTCAAHTHDTTSQKHALQQHDDITTRGSINNTTWQVLNVNSEHPQQHVTKNFMTKSYTRSDRNNLYIMTSSMCNTSRQTFFSHDSMRPILGMRRRAFPALYKTHYPRWQTNIDTYRQQTKTKLPNKDPSMRNRTEQASLVTLQMTDMLKHGARFMTYYGITHRVTPHKVTNITTKLYLRRDASNGRVQQWNKIIVDSQGLKRGHF
jgi:hypothetical protein